MIATVVKHYDNDASVVMKCYRKITGVSIVNESFPSSKIYFSAIKSATNKV